MPKQSAPTLEETLIGGGLEDVQIHTNETQTIAPVDAPLEAVAESEVAAPVAAPAEVVDTPAEEPIPATATEVVEIPVEESIAAEASDEQP